jgi:hypothetical protein
MKADTIITTDDANAINQVRELQNATANVDTANAGTFNVYKNAYKHGVLVLLAGLVLYLKNIMKVLKLVLIVLKHTCFS